MTKDKEKGKEKSKKERKMYGEKKTNKQETGAEYDGHWKKSANREQENKKQKKRN